MADVQLENGFTRIANALLEAIIKFDFSKREYKVLLAVIRKTYGWNKKMDRISSTQLAEMTGLDQSHCAKTLKALVEKKVISREYFVVKAQKNHAEWIGQNSLGQNSLGKRPKRPGKLGQNGLDAQAKTAYTKDRIKDNKETLKERAPLFVGAAPIKKRKPADIIREKNPELLQTILKIGGKI